MQTAPSRQRRSLAALIPFVALHAACVLVVFQPITARLFVLALATYALRVLFEI